MLDSCGGTGTGQWRNEVSALRSVVDNIDSINLTLLAYQWVKIRGHPGIDSHICAMRILSTSVQLHMTELYIGLSSSYRGSNQWVVMPRSPPLC